MVSIAYIPKIIGLRADSTFSEYPYLRVGTMTLANMGITREGLDDF